MLANLFQYFFLKFSNNKKSLWSLKNCISRLLLCKYKNTNVHVIEITILMHNKQIKTTLDKNKSFKKNTNYQVVIIKLVSYKKFKKKKI